MFKLVAIFVLCICGIQGQIPFSGECPDVSVVENFDLSRYLGKWYEQYRYMNFFELLGNCGTAEYSLNENGTVSVRNSQIQVFSGATKVIQGYAEPAGDITEAKFLVNFPVGGYHANAPYWILDTDYDKYAIVWSCTNLGPESFRFLWLLTREKDCGEDVINNMFEILARNNISTDSVVSSNQSKC